MIDVIMGFGTNVHILWVIGVLGLLMKLGVNLHMKSLIKASENMATTKKRCLNIMRQKFVNGRNLGINRGDGAAFVEKNVRRLKWAGLPLEFWKKSGLVLSLATIMLMAGSFMYYETRWRGSQEMITFLANGVLVCAFLYAIENIFLINNKLEILKANIKDYLENLSLPPSREKPNMDTSREFSGLRKIGGVTEQSKAGAVIDNKDGEVEVAATFAAASEGSREKENACGKQAAVKRDATFEAAIENDRMLDSFLKEFFS